MTLFKKLTAKLDGPHPDMAEFERLLAGAQSERQTLQEMLSSVNGCVTEIPAVRRGLDEVDRRASELAERLVTIAASVDTLTHASRSIAELDKRTAAIDASIRKAETRATEVDDQCQSLQEMVSMALQTLARLEAAKQDSAEIARFDDQLPRVRDECRRVLDQQTTLAGDIELLHKMTAALIEDAAMTRQASREAREDADSAARTIGDVQQKIEHLSHCQALEHDTDEQLQSLNALAEHVSAKMKALDTQQQTVERALVDSRRVQEMVWDMEVQILKLTDGAAAATRIEENLARLDRLREDTTGQLDEAIRARDEFTEKYARRQKDAEEVMKAVQGHLDRLALKKEELETVRERIASAQSALDDTEARLGAVSRTEETIVRLGSTVDAVSSRLREASVQVEALQQRQATLSTLEDRLNELDVIAKRTLWQFESISTRSGELEAIKAQFAAFDETSVSAHALVDQLRSDKHEFAQFVEQTRGFMGSAHEIERHIEGLTSSVAAVEVRAARVTGLAPKVEEIATQLDLLGPRLPAVEDLHARLNALNTLSVEVDSKLAAQLARQAELVSAGVTYDGLAGQIADAQQKLAALAAFQMRLASLPEQVSNVEHDLSATRDALNALRQDGEALAAQERRLIALNESAQALTDDIASRVETAQALEAELQHLCALKDNLRADLAQIQSTQREAVISGKEAADHLQQLTAGWKQIDRRRADLSAVESSLRAVEGRVEQLQRLSDSLDGKIESLAERERIVVAVKREIETIHEIARKSHEDLAAVADRRHEISHDRAEVDRLFQALAAADQKVGEIERRSRTVDEVRRKADAVAHLLEDVHVTLDTLGTQKAMLDEVSERLGGLDAVIADAQGTTKALQAERKIAQRIVENVRTIHNRANAEIRPAG